MSRNSHLESENRRLTKTVDEMKDICSLTSSLNVKYKLQLEKETTENEILKESNQKVKLKLNQLSAKCIEQSQRIKILESHLTRHAAVRVAKPIVRIVSSVPEGVVTDPMKSDAFIDLQARYDELDAAHHEALNVIDELEFELGDVMSEKSHLQTINPTGVDDMHLKRAVLSLSFHVSPHQQIDYLEMETQRLRRENEKLKEMLQQAGIP